MISACTGSLDEEDLVKCMVAGKQTLEKCKLSVGLMLASIEHACIDFRKPIVSLLESLPSERKGLYFVKHYK